MALKPSSDFLSRNADRRVESEAVYVMARSKFIYVIKFHSTTIEYISLYDLIYPIFFSPPIYSTTVLFYMLLHSLVKLISSFVISSKCCCSNG